MRLKAKSDNDCNDPEAGDMQMNDASEKNECEITLVSPDGASFYLYLGEKYINQMLLTDGDFPRPVRCLHFSSVLDTNYFLGEGITISQLWGIHPDIVARLRDNNHLLEMKAPNV
jgi:hypothetical protein